MWGQRSCQKWLENPNSGDERDLCLNAAWDAGDSIGYDETGEAKPNAGVQGENGIGGGQARGGAVGAGAAVRCACQLGSPSFALAKNAPWNALQFKKALCVAAQNGSPVAFIEVRLSNPVGPD